jgi:hypothetical protein
MVSVSIPQETYIPIEYKSHITKEYSLKYRNFCVQYAVILQVPPALVVSMTQEAFHTMDITSLYQKEAEDTVSNIPNELLYDTHNSKMELLEVKLVQSLQTRLRHKNDMLNHVPQAGKDLWWNLTYELDSSFGASCDSAFWLLRYSVYRNIIIYVWDPILGSLSSCTDSSS